MTPALWQDKQVEAVARQACPGVALGREELEWGAAALLQLEYQLAGQQEGVQHRLEDIKRQWRELKQQLLAPPSHRTVLTTTIVTSSTTRLLPLYEKQLRTGGEGKNCRQGLELRYRVAASAEEEWPGCPPQP